MKFDNEMSLMEEPGEARLIFANFTSSLLVVNSTLLAYAGIAAIVGGGILLALYYLANVSQSSSGYGYQYSNYQYSRGFRGEDGGTASSKILTLLSVASDIYSKMNYDDVDCQKKIICEFMDQPEMFGQGGTQVKSGVQWAASWLAPFGFSIVDQISEAATLNDEGECEQRYKECQKISLKDTYKEKVEEVKRVEDDLKKNDDKEKIDESTEYEYEYYYDRK